MSDCKRNSLSDLATLADAEGYLDSDMLQVSASCQAFTAKAIHNALFAASSAAQEN